MPNEICVDNLRKNVDVPMLCQLFKKHGRILSCSIDVDKHFNSSGKGYISFDNPSSAQSAVKCMNGSTFQENKIKVSLEVSDLESSIKALKERFTKIFVKNINPSWDDLDLENEFAGFGEVKECQISTHDGKSNGFGFVIFKEHSAAKAAVNHKHKHLIVEPYIPKAIRAERPTSPESAKDLLKKSVQFNNLYVKNIPKSMDDRELETLFEKFGKIKSVKVARDGEERSKGFGFVCFDSQDDAEKARSQMNGYSLNNNTLVVSFHQKKDARKQFLAMKSLESDEKIQQDAKATVKETFQSKKTIFSFSSKK